MAWQFSIVPPTKIDIRIPEMGVLSFDKLAITRCCWERFLSTERSSYDFELDTRFILKKLLNEVCLFDVILDGRVWCVSWVHFKEHMFKILDQIFTPDCNRHCLPKPHCNGCDALTYARSSTSPNE